MNTQQSFSTRVRSASSTLRSAAQSRVWRQRGTGALSAAGVTALGALTGMAIHNNYLTSAKIQRNVPTFRAGHTSYCISPETSQCSAASAQAKTKALGDLIDGLPSRADTDPQTYVVYFPQASIDEAEHLQLAVKDVSRNWLGGARFNPNDNLIGFDAAGDMVTYSPNNPTDPLLMGFEAGYDAGRANFTNAHPYLPYGLGALFAAGGTLAGFVYGFSRGYYRR
jgi:hypothetical protein